MIDRCVCILIITSQLLFIINEFNKHNYITFLIYNANIFHNNAESGKVPRMLAAFPR
jgi:hypothetical protein